MQSWSTMTEIDLTGGLLHYLYSSWLSVTLYVLQINMLLNQLSNFLGVLLLSNRQTDVNTSNCVQPIRQGRPLTLGIKPL